MVRRRPGRQRPRPRKKHPKDFAYVRDHEVSPEKHTYDHIFALGMHGGMPRDKARIQMLMVQTGCTSVTTVSETEEVSKLKGVTHLSVDFKPERGARRIEEAIRERYSKGAKILVVLDYFWLQGSYYATNYGLLWLSRHAVRLSEAGAEILLPWDKRREVGNPESSDMEQMLLAVPAGLSVTFVKGEANPLWVASDPDWICDPAYKWKRPFTNPMMMDRLNEDNPFVRIAPNYKEMLSHPNSRMDGPCPWSELKAALVVVVVLLLLLLLLLLKQLLLLGQL